jgi:hypothetical protein
MHIYLERDDNSYRYLGKGGARKFRKYLRALGNHDAVVVGYHNNNPVVKGYTFSWPTEKLVPIEGGYYISRGWHTWTKVVYLK